ncbi:MAG: hypothetical protein A2V21_307150 [Deltaproteobacteria bacterium GWC2_55_46]|nr:MAG: hypothetical protein A2Z79_01240 [Deltaproteobacteria bacterium GWA2_55_82]OGQ62083.1 MAG: hypothetical protein A3I81_03965 [Deltaproteobacteria bacterium RIFCSPLOWO2_02_FULL_55_12]OIJ74057.1 MAG: hypothetical protein A2V21_307150 [Deltaproteobacteria bacterium GWC2_55_46]
MEEARRKTILDGLLPHQKLLLFSEGSMTLELELLTQGNVEAEIRFMGLTSITAEAASFLGAEVGAEAMEREVWLTGGGRRLLYAHALIPEGMIAPDIKSALDERPKEPLGRVLASNGVLFAKERLEIGIVKSPCASRDLEIPEDTPLFARRYILFNKGADRWIIKAGLTEIFSPELVGAVLRS